MQDPPGSPLTIQSRLEQFLSSFSVKRHVYVPGVSAESGPVSAACSFPWPTLILQCSGHTEVATARESLELGPGDAIVIAPSLLHAETIRSPEREYANLWITQTVGGTAIHCHGYLNLPQPILTDGIGLDVPDLRLADALDEILRTSWTSSEEAARDNARRLFTVLADLLHALSEATAEPKYGQSTVDECIRLIQLELSNQRLSVTRLAQMLAVHPNYLSSLFHQTVGLTLKAFITARRMRLARFLVLHTYMRSSEIAWVSGYHSPGYFTRLFKQTHGLSPTSYRREHPSPTRSPEFDSSSASALSWSN